MLPSPSSVSASSSIVHRVVHYASFLSSTDPVPFYRIATFRFDQNFEVLSFGPFKMAPSGPFYIMARKYPSASEIYSSLISREYQMLMDPKLRRNKDSMSRSKA